MTDQSHIIVVIGPGRSGTSAITRGLKVLGVDLGENLMPPKSGVNDKGFWEDLDIYNLNREIYEEIKKDWHLLTSIKFDLAKKEHLNSLKQRATNLIINKLKFKGLFGFKDPQITRILCFWHDIFSELSIKESYIIACRNPKSVARSLSKYTGFTLEKSYLLWFVQTVTSLIETNSYNRLVVNYDFLMNNPTEQLQRIASALGLIISSGGDELLDYQEVFLDNDLRHHEYDLEELKLDESVPQKCVFLYELMLNFSSDKISINCKTALEEIDKLKSFLHDTEFTMKYAQGCEDELSATVAKLVERDQRIAQLSEIVDECGKLTTNLKQKVDSLVVECDSQLKVLEQKEDAIGQLSRLNEENVAQLYGFIGAANEQIGNLGLINNSLIIERDSLLRMLERKEEAITQLSRSNDENVAHLYGIIGAANEQLTNLGLINNSLSIERDSLLRMLERKEEAITQLSRSNDENVAHLYGIIGAANEQLTNLGLINNSLLVDRDFQKTSLTQTQETLTQFVQFHEDHIADLSETIVARDKFIEEISRELSSLYNSKSWRLTSTLRSLARLVT